MKIQKILAVLTVAAVLDAAAAHSQDLFRVRFRAKCTPSDTVNGRRTTTLTERDLIAECVGNGFSNAELNRNFALVYNPTADSIQVVNAADGTQLCDIFEFQPGTNVLTGNQLQRFVFVFSPSDTNAIGTAVITERSVNGNNNRANITGKIQFTMTANTITNGTGATNNLSIPTSTGGTTNDQGTGTVNNDTNGITGTGQFVQTNAIPTATASGVQICQGTFTAGKLFVAGANLASARRSNARANTRVATTSGNTISGGNTVGVIPTVETGTNASATTTNANATTTVVTTNVTTIATNSVSSTNTITGVTPTVPTP